jgi:hypothetical protein
LFDLINVRTFSLPLFFFVLETPSSPCLFFPLPFPAPSPCLLRCFLHLSPTPDVGLVTSLSDFSTLDTYFSQFLLPASDGGFPASKIKKVLPPDWTNVARQEVAKTLAVEEGRVV